MSSCNSLTYVTDVTWDGIHKEDYSFKCVYCITIWLGKVVLLSVMSLQENFHNFWYHLFLFGGIPSYKFQFFSVAYYKVSFL